MRRVLVGLVSCFLMLSGHYSFAQEAKTQAAPVKRAWKFEFTVSEVEAGKVINERRYSMLMLGQGRESIRAGNQVPIVTSVNNTVSTQYMDVALGIDCEVHETSQGITPVRVIFEISSLAGDQTRGSDNPVTRFVRGSSNFMLNPGKKEVIITADDVNTKRQYQVAFLATQLN